MIIKKYENLLNLLNNEIQNGTFDIEKNKEYIEKIMEIYKESKLKNYSKVKSLLEDIEIFYETSLNSFDLKKSFLSISNPGKAFKGGFGNEKDKNDDLVGVNIEEKSIPDGEIDMAFGELRDWNTSDFDEDNIENFNSVEMISALFLQNLKEKIGEK